jgi:hypothetical protein
MRIIAPFLIALFAIMGIAAATVDYVEITSPHDGDQFTLGDTVKIRSEVSGSNEGYLGARMFINGERVRTSNWVPTEAGEYTIMVQAADNREFTNPISDTVTITVS